MYRDVYVTRKDNTDQLVRVQSTNQLDTTTVLKAAHYAIYRNVYRNSVTTNCRLAAEPTVIINMDADTIANAVYGGPEHQPQQALVQVGHFDAELEKLALPDNEPSEARLMQHYRRILRKANGGAGVNELTDVQMFNTCTDEQKLRLEQDMQFALANGMSKIEYLSGLVEWCSSPPQDGQNQWTDEERVTSYLDEAAFLQTSNLDDPFLAPGFTY